MKQYVLEDEWNIIEDGFHPEENKIYESIMSLGNGNMGMRGNFEEDYTGSSLKGTYIAGVYYPDKTRVGWWKNGYPEYFAKVLNSANIIGIKVVLNGENLDLAKTKYRNFKRVLNMRDGYLMRTFIVMDSKGRETEIETKRFVSIDRKEIAAIYYKVTALNYDGDLEITPYLDGNVYNEDSNYGEAFWDEVDKNVYDYKADITLKTKKLDFYVAVSMATEIIEQNKKAEISIERISSEKYVGNNLRLKLTKGKTVTLNKFVSVVSNRYFENQELTQKSYEFLNSAVDLGYDGLLKEHSEKWHEHWNKSDIVIKGDIKAQQSIRFNIFQLDQTYTGDDPRLNIGPKGFTGEKYGGSTYWDTEAYCIPFYLSTAEASIAKNLLIYRYKQLDKAIENAEKLGFTNGAALYPMVTMNGEECHNEWEITFEEIHRNGAIAYAIYDYINYTGDKDYLIPRGLEVLIGIARFWAQRVNYSAEKGKYVMLGVTGPNEYENNVNNNWYTNTIATWTMQYALESIEYVKSKDSEAYKAIKNKISFDDKNEMANWKEIIDNMYFPENKSRGIFLQQDGYLDKEQLLVKDIDPKELPINKHWSWDRILRSCFIKQADVLQGIYFFENRFDIDTVRRNFEFYEPRTVHESSLSSCVHSIIAAKLGKQKKAYELYLRTARLDLDNYNADTEDGLHITSMAGTWMSIVYGFGGMRVKDSILIFNPFIPEGWENYSFKVMYRDNLLSINIDKNNVNINVEKGNKLKIKVYDNDYEVRPDMNLKIKLKDCQED